MYVHYRTGKLEIEFSVKIIQKTWFSRVRRCPQTVVAAWLYNNNNNIFNL
jgi:hypothetical protein